MKMSYKIILGWVIVATTSVWSPADAAAQTWAMTQFSSRAIEPANVATFQDLLQNELSNQKGVSFVRLEKPCSDAACASAAARKSGADAAVYGSVSTLGKKVIVTVDVVDSDGGGMHAERMTIDRVDELDIVASRIATAITTNQPVEATAELGSITTKETKVEKRRHGLSGLALGVGALASAHGYANVPVGIAFDLAWWYEAPAFAIGPRVGLRFQPDVDADEAFVEVPIDIGAYYVMGLGDVAPFFGGGAGVRYIHDSRFQQVRVGSVITTTHGADVEDNVWGFGAYARLGVLLFRTYSVRTSVSADYNITFAEVNGESIPQSFTFMLSVYF